MDHHSSLVPPDSLLIGGQVEPGPLRDAVEEARTLGVERVLVRTDEPEVERAAEQLDVTPVGSGREEVAEAAEELMERVRRGDLEPDDLETRHLEDSLRGDVDAVLVVGERRLLDAALWGTAYSEYFFADELTPESVRETIEEFEQRTRRFGR